MQADAVLFAAVGDLKYDHDPTAKVRPETGLLAMRKKLGLFANVRPVATFDCLLHKSPLKDELIRGADFVVLRELTGGMYFGEKYQDNDKAYDTDCDSVGRVNGQFITSGKMTPEKYAQQLEEWSE